MDKNAVMSGLSVLQSAFSGLWAGWWMTSEPSCRPAGDLKTASMHGLEYINASERPLREQTSGADAPNPCHPYAHGYSTLQ